MSVRNTVVVCQRISTNCTDGRHGMLDSKIKEMYVYIYEYICVCVCFFHTNTVHLDTLLGFDIVGIIRVGSSDLMYTGTKNGKTPFFFLLDDKSKEPS